jgi:hypothetical protein
MSTQPPSAEQAATADQPSTDHLGEGSKYCARVLLDLVEKGHELAAMLMREAKAQEESGAPAPAAGRSPMRQAVADFACITRAVRRTVMLYQKLIDPARASARAHRVIARKKIIRDVEDAIHHNAPEGEQETLHAELMERLDRPDLEDEIADRPIADIVTDINRDLGITGLYDGHPWKRRIPHDIAVLSARAEQLAGAPPSQKLLALLATAPKRREPASTLTAVNLPKLSDKELDSLIRQCGPIPDS